MEDCVLHIGGGHGRFGGRDGGRGPACGLGAVESTEGASEIWNFA